MCIYVWKVDFDFEEKPRTEFTRLQTEAVHVKQVEPRQLRSNCYGESIHTWMFEQEKNKYEMK